MSIYIPGMKMPKNCIDCAFGWNGWCHRINSRAFVEVDMRRHDCPLIEIPPHGRLIDADAFVKQYREWYCENCERRKNSKGHFVYEVGDAPCRACDIGDMIDAVDDYTTIIPADGGE